VTTPFPERQYTNRRYVFPIFLSGKALAAGMTTPFPERHGTNRRFTQRKPAAKLQTVHIAKPLA
jgi:hypothetical protein